jgi:Fe-S cluster assembly iron-binding protein IscA
MSKREAIIGIAPCPTGQIYGVRIEIKQDKWIATWTFPITKEVADREGFSTNYFPDVLQYDQDYPGCPYCKQHEDLAKLTKNVKVEGKGRNIKDIVISVTSKGCDDMEYLLKMLKLPYKPYNSIKFNCDMLFMSCLTADQIDCNELRNFVDKGGCLYASDLVEDKLTIAFPGLFNFEGRNGKIMKINATVEDQEIKSISGDNVQIEFDMPSWAVLNSVQGDVLLRASSGSPYSGKPIMVKVKYGEGVIFYTSFHNHANASESETAFLTLLILKQIGEVFNTDLGTTISDAGLDLNELKSKFKIF